jgi:hypothetical protein
MSAPILPDERRAIRYTAHFTVARAIRKGELASPRGMACADCGGGAIEYDHRDYTQPLMVEPVCRRCNLRRGPALKWTADGRRPVDFRVARHLPPDVLSDVLRRLGAATNAVEV